jgi:diguanylate cyclase (GGDEF)-like protein
MNRDMTTQAAESDVASAPEGARRPPGDLQPLLRSLASTRTVRDACEAACEHIVALPGGLMPSIYFERDGLLRCESQRGYWQVLDGIKLDSGILARVFHTGEPVTLDDMAADVATLHAVPGLQVETCVPLVVGSQIVGVLNVEAAQPFHEAVVEHVENSAGALSARLSQLWIEVEQSPLERLARTSRELTGLTEEGEIRDALVRLASYVTGMSSAVLVLTTGDGGLRVVAEHGELSSSFHALSGTDLARLREMVSQASSWYTNAGRSGRSDPAADQLRAAGAASLAAVPMRGLGGVDPAAVVGFLATVDVDDVLMGTGDIEALELLGEEGARCLRLALTFADLQARADRDPLTGLGNHRKFHETLSAAESGGRADWAILLADLDGFKAINDGHGHVRGDAVLRDLAAALQVAVRAGERVFRVGGDEFAVVLRTRHRERVGQIAARLSASAARVLGPYGAGMSVGAALPRPGESSVSCLERADAALYEAKRTAPGTHVVATDPA